MPESFQQVETMRQALLMEGCSFTVERTGSVVLALALSLTQSAILIEMDSRTGLYNVRQFDQHAGCQKVVGLSNATLCDHSGQQICFSHLTIFTAGDIFMYKGLEGDFENIKDTDPFVISKGATMPRDFDL